MPFSSQTYLRLKKSLIALLGVLTVIPLAPVINRYIPALMVGSWNLDMIMSVLIAAAVTAAVIRMFQWLIIPSLVLFLAVVTYNGIRGGPGVSGVIQDYQVMVKGNWGKMEQKQKDLTLMPSFFDGPLARTVKALRSKVNHQDSVVRNFAVQASLQHFDEHLPKYGSIVRALSLFKTINNNFRYVSDAERDEYFATPRETILNGLGGDCDDHSILMVSAMKAIGVHTRMVLTEGHLYPELFCGTEKNFEKISAAIMHLFAQEVGGNIYYHEDEGIYWINLDYSARHPGGPYASDKAFAIILP